jgi:5-methylcytosine-specific restriction endonuclease McrA
VATRKKPGSGRGRSTRRWRQVRKEAYERDSARHAKCWICGGDIDYAAPPGTPDAWEPDHYWPPKVRPDLAEDITNIRPAHCSCNRARGDRMIKGSGLGSPTRKW